MSQVWVIKAGEKGKDQAFALREKCAVIGWGWLGDLSDSRYDERQAVVDEVFKERDEQRGAAYASQPWRFAKTVQDGDWIILPLRDKRGNRNGYFAAGKAKGDYQYVKGAPEGCRHQRPVEEWKEFPNGDIPHTLSNQMTISKIKEEEEMVIAALEGRGATVSDSDDAISDGPNGVKQLILRDFKGHAMQDIIIQILGAMKYDCPEVSKPNTPDGGVDIFATHRELTASICVEVKSGKAKMKETNLRNLAGAMTKRHVGNGLFVSWSGFGSPKKRDELKEEYPFIRLWDAEDVLRLVDEHYDKFDNDFKRKRLPLKRELVVDLGALEAAGSVQ